MHWGQRGTAGGLDRIYTDLVNYLPDYSFRVTGTVHTPDDVSTVSGGRVHSFAAADASMLGRYLGVRRLIGEILRAEKIDLVAVHFALYAALALDRLRGPPLVMHFHGPWFSESAEEAAGRSTVQAKRWIEQRVYRRADRIIVLSQAFANLVVREFGFPEERVSIVPGHVDLERFAPMVTRTEARAALGWPTDRPILVSVRRLRHRMGLDRLITAMREVVAKVPDVLLCIGGQGPLRAALEQQVAEDGLSRHVRFLGFVPEADLPFVYRAADLNVVPTVALEGFGLVAAEALAAGTPSMVTPVGGLPEVVAPLSAALLFRSSATFDLADGLVRSLRNLTSLPDEMACQAFATANFARQTATDRVAQVYREVLGETEQ